MKQYLQKFKTYKINEAQNTILYFFIFAFMGWTLETFYSLIVLGHFTKRGFLFGPLCPIYGYSALIMIAFFKKYKNNSLKLFFHSVIIFSGFEYLAGFALDALFAIRLWDYRQDFFNLNGRISIFYSLSWGIIAILFVNHIFPFIEKKVNILLKNIPLIFQSITTFFLVFIYSIDTIISFIRWR